ncbi:MAG: GTPase HflX [Candidatus Cloacimonetes bacterium]|nr:GTPase HflX [Candidatus Cloacimonadota bacterium]
MSQSENSRLKEVKAKLPKAHLIGICEGLLEEKEKSMQELKLLVQTMGLETESINIQKRDHPSKTLYTGSGFMEEVTAKMAAGDILIFDNDLQPSQIRNISKKFEVEILDRTEVILEIFQQHARSKEAVIQVNLARYEYELPRLRNLWKHLDRERGTAKTGGTSRGSGETQLELDRRYVRQKISKARKDLKKIASQKEVQRQYRFSHFKKVCIVGYTNAGKSTLFNALTDAKVLVEDKLFATLESTSKALNLGKGKDVILSDTVGFISKLPHHLVASFRATLQEVIDADLLLHVVDAADKDFETHINDVETVLSEIKAENIASLIVFNKIDLISAEEKEEILEKYPESLLVSAAKELGLEILLDVVDRKLNIAHVIKILVPHQEQKTISHLNKLGVVLERKYQEEGVLMEVLINEEDMQKFIQWKI